MDPSSGRNQATYRALLQAVSGPGSSVRLSGLETLSPLASIRAVVECLLDHEVGVCILGARPVPAALAAAVAATGARPMPIDRADFLVVVGPDSRGGLTAARRGSHESPEDGATVIYSLDGAGAPSADRFRVRLEGPGIAEAGGRVPDMRGIPAPELQALSEVNADYPLGVDAFFVRPSGEVMALPRSTRIQVR
jgi:alpha-D-ribose 1-methylphosphonate 5-triphosphate synthase subunit PhnH